MKMSLRISALAALAALFAGWPGVFGQTPAETKVDGPRIKFLETSYDFGRIQPTEKLTHDFIVTNLGNAVLRITDVTSSCGCTTLGAWDREVPPKGTGRIPVNFDPAALWGSTIKTVTVSCNDPTHPGDSLQIKATVWRDVEVEPQTTHFVQVEGEMTNQTRTVRILNNLDDPLTLEPPQSTNPNFVPELTTVKAGREFALKITCLGQLTDKPQGTITIPTSSRKMSVLNVSAYVMRQPALVVTPAQIQVPHGLADAKLEAVVLVRNHSRTPLKITEARVNADDVTVQTVVADPGKFFNFRIIFPPRFHVPAGESLVLSFKTSHPNYPLVRVPIIDVPSPAPAARQK
jgi:hypothetical protein